MFKVTLIYSMNCDIFLLGDQCVLNPYLPWPLLSLLLIQTQRGSIGHCYMSLKVMGIIISMREYWRADSYQNNTGSSHCSPRTWRPKDKPRVWVRCLQMQWIFGNPIHCHITYPFSERTQVRKTGVLQNACLCSAALCSVLPNSLPPHGLSPGSPVLGISQKQYWSGSPISTPGKTATHFPRQEYWSGLPFPDLGIEPVSLASPALAGGFLTTEPPGKPTCLPNLLENHNSLDVGWLSQIAWPYGWAVRCLSSRKG